MNIELIVPLELQKVLRTIKRKDTRNVLLLIYNTLIFKNTKYNKDKQNQFFPVPSSYLEKVNSRYYNYIKILIDNNIIEYKTLNNGFKQEDIFAEEEWYSKKYYNTHTGDCMQYKFNIDTTQGEEKIIEIPDFLYKNYGWYKITYNSLQQIKLDTKITRDSFSRRLHTSITSNTQVDDFNSYKTYLSALGGYSAIDIKECQPTFLFNFLKDKMEIDNNYTCYTIYSKINSDRELAKKEFVTWLNGKVNEMPKHINLLFPKMTDFIIKYKNKNGYKSLGAKLQRIESKIVIDDLLDNIVEDININFCLSVHDSLIVKNNDVEKVYNYVTSKYPALQFKKEKI